MNCNEAAALLPTYSDGELDPMQSAAVEKHLLGCSDCAARRDKQIALGVRIKRDVPYFPAPPTMRSRIDAALAGTLTATRSRPVRDRWRWLGAGAFAGCLATVLAWFMGSAVLEWRDGTDLAAEAVANHVRATLSNHLTDVATSDRHTVKPWLSARLDYSPPVQDLSGEGFALTGGRVDYLDRHAVAALVYRYREHVIDVFVRPGPKSAARSSRPPVSIVRGFNVARASGAGMDWLAVSDTSAEVLTAFVARLARGDAAP
ncbi:MAG TPA: zf-HC2 domain-containing protein [Casimicrobiaceae bacterium]|nr:zf-HC2 domain-containing protein [Casimicrobiaceae bacterium]